MVLVASGCSQEFVALPEASGVQGWLLISSSNEGHVFGFDEFANFDLNNGVRLAALPVGPAGLGVASGPVLLGSGRPLAMLGSYVWQPPKWTMSEASRVELRFDVDSCASQCLSMITCRNCSVTPRMQGCGDCPAVLEVAPPRLPDRTCPPGWTSTEEPDGHQICSAPRPPGFEEPCALGQRWSMQNAGCIDVAPCADPEVPPADVVFVDAAAGPAGSGTPADPFGTFAEALAGTASTIIMRPGTYTESLNIDRPVAVVGHGACTEIRGALNRVAVDVAALGVTIEAVSITAEGDSQLLTVQETASLRLARSHLMSTRQAIRARGPLTLVSSLVEQTEGCLANCEVYLLNFSKGGVIESSELRGAPLVNASGGDVRVTDSRFLGDGSNGRALSLTGVGDLFVHRSAVFGFHTGISAKTPATVDIRDSWFTSVNIEGPDTQLNGASIALSNMDPRPTTAQFERVDIKSEAFAISMVNANLTARQLRVDSEGMGLYQTAEQGDLQADIDSAWIDYESFGLRALDANFELSQVWLRRREGLVPRENELFGAIVGRDQALNARRLHILAGGENGVLGFRDFDAEDLTVLGAGKAAIDNQRAKSFEPDIRGRRWLLQSDGTGVTLVGSFDLQDIRIAPQTEGVPSTPVCLHLRSTGAMRKFALSTAETQNAILVLDPAFREVALEAVTFSEGSIDSGKFIAATSDCLRAQPGLDAIPSMDDVAYR